MAGKTQKRRAAAQAAGSQMAASSRRGRKAGLARKCLTLAIAVLMAALLSVPALAAGEPEFQISIDNLNLTKGASTTIVVSITNAQDAEVVSIDGIENFDILSQSQSSSTSIVGWDVTVIREIKFIVIPKKEGQFPMKAFIRFDGQVYETNSLDVTVSESPTTGDGAQSELFVDTVISHSEAFLGEKVVIAFELYSRYELESYGFTDYTAIDGVMAREMPVDQLMSEDVYIGGARYEKYVVKQLLLDPIKSGEYTIPSFNIQANVISNADPGASYDPFGGMFPGFWGGGSGGLFRVSTPMYLQTEEKQLTVKPLPMEGKPSDFSGIVGELSLEGSYSREAVDYGDSLTLRATASGSCNLDGLKNITSGRLPGFSVYETQNSVAESIEGNEYNISKGFEAIIVPERIGAVKMPAISISYFDPAAESYKTAEIPGVTIEVTGNMAQTSPGGAAGASGFSTVVVNQVSYSGTDDGYFSLQVKKEYVYGAMIGVVALIFLAIVLYRVISRKKKEDQELKSLYRRLSGAREANEAYDVFCEMIKHCYGLSLKASSQSTVRSSLPDDGLAAKVTDVMRFMESGDARDGNGLDKLRDKIKDVYKSLIP